MRSLRSRVLAWTIGGMALVLVVFGAAVYVMARHFASEEFDNSLQAAAQALAALVKVEDGKAEMELEDPDMPEFSRARRPAYFELWDGPAVVRRSASLGQQDLDLPGGSGKKRWCQAAKLPDGRAGRIAVLVFVPRAEPADEDGGGQDRTHDDKASTSSRVGGGGQNRTHDDRVSMSYHPITLAVARETRKMDEALASLGWLLAGGAAVSVLAMLVAASLVVRHGLGPLGALAGRIAAIRPENLAARVPTDGMPAEIAPVAARLNELLGRLEDALGRERALTADVAHELRTPLGGLQSTIEVALARSREADEYRQALADCLDIVRQTGGMAANLLVLARLEGGQVSLRPEPIRLAELVEATWRPHASRARGRGITLADRLAPDLACAADREILAIVLANLLANAAEYTPDGGLVEVAGRLGDDAVVLTFSNTGCTLSADEAARVFDRFWRGDAARSGTGVHCGLGLSLVDRAAHVLGGTVAAQVADGRFVVTVVLPVR